VWGDTVNTASRLETASEPGKINISRDFLDRVKKIADVEPRGLQPIKGKGEMEMYFVRGLKPSR
jgi:class 3 adenylate cyclase